MNHYPKTRLSSNPDPPDSKSLKNPVSCLLTPFSSLRAGFSLLLFSASLLFAEQFNSLGDLDNNDVVDVADVVMLINIILSDEEINHLLFWAADLNIDDEINVIDIILQVDIILGLLDYPICQNDHCNCYREPGECCICGEYFIWEFEKFYEIPGSFSTVIHFGENDIWIGGDLAAAEYMEQNILRWNGEFWEIQIWHGYYYSGGWWQSTIPYIIDINGHSPDNVWFSATSCTNYNWNGYEVIELTDCNDVLGDYPSPFWISPTGTMYSGNNDESLNIFDGENHQIIPLNSQTEDLPFCSNTIGIWGLDDNNVFTIHRNNIMPFNCPSALAYWDGIEYTILHNFGNSEESFRGIWGYEDTLYVGSQSGLLVRTISTGEEFIIGENDGFPIWLTSNIHFIDGNDSEDFIIMGKYGGYVFFDDSGFQLYSELELHNYTVNINDVYFRDDLIVVIGSEYYYNGGATPIVISGYKR